MESNNKITAKNIQGDAEEVSEDTAILNDALIMEENEDVHKKTSNAHVTEQLSIREVKKEKKTCGPQVISVEKVNYSLPRGSSRNAPSTSTEREVSFDYEDEDEMGWEEDLPPSKQIALGNENRFH